MEKVKFKQMKDGDRDDYAMLDEKERAYAAGTADRLLGALVELDASLSGYQISRLGHSLQAATRAWRAGADDDWVVSALLHDIGDIYAPYNHDEYAASILRPFVREQCAWVVEKHGDFQMLYYGHHVGGNQNKRDQWRGHPYFDDCAHFCEYWDQSSFDPGYPNLPVDFFAPMVRAVFARPAYGQDHVRPGHRAPMEDLMLARERNG